MLPLIYDFKKIKNKYIKLNLSCLSLIPDMVPSLEKNIDKVYWDYLSENPNAIHILEKNLDKVDWFCLQQNKNIMQLIPLDYEKMRERNKLFAEELTSKVFNPMRLMNICETYNCEFEDLLDNVY